MPSHILSATTIGVSCELIDIEADYYNSPSPGITIVGLPDKAVEESRSRIRSAIKNSGLKFLPKRWVINLAPADIKKYGPSYDVPIALSIMHASKYIKDDDFSRSVFVGELGLDGKIKPTTGVLPIVADLKNQGIDHFYVPYGNAQEAVMVDNVTIYAPQTLKDIVAHLNGTKKIKPQSRVKYKLTRKEHEYDFSNVHGQKHAKRALEIAAAGAHNIIMSGPPGSGKTLLARSLPSILPPLSTEEQIEVSKLYSISGLLLKKSLITERPFRSPHHTSSHAALVGGGSWPRPGEITLAHRGVLFLDELPEFPRGVLETLRQPLEDSSITICRTNLTVKYPAQFMLVAAMNPCPCGYKNDPYNECSCTMHQIQNYQKKISGPLLDRIDMHIHVPKVQTEEIMKRSESESSSKIAKRVYQARATQNTRFKNERFITNAELPAKKLKQFCKLTDDANKLMYEALTKLNLSARSYSRMIKVARTIADLDNSNVIGEKHLAEGMLYRF